MVTSINHQYQKVQEKLDRHKIVLDGAGEFPKRLVIFERGRMVEYRIVKTKAGKFILNK